MVLRDLVQDCSNSKVPFLRLDPIRSQLQLGESDDALLAREAVVADLTRVLEQLSVKTLASWMQGGVPDPRRHGSTRRSACAVGATLADQGLVFEWVQFDQQIQLMVSRHVAHQFLLSRPSRSSRGYRHSEEVKRLSLLDPEQAKDVPRETLRRWRTQGKTRDRGREDRAAGLAWRWGIAGHRWSRHASISDDTRRRRVQRDRVRRLQHLNAAHPIADAPRVSGAPEAVLQFVQNRWAAHQLIMGLQSSSSFDLIVEAEDVLRRCGWWYPKCFDGPPDEHGALSALLMAILGGEYVRFAGRLRIEVERAQHGVMRSSNPIDPFGPTLPGFGCRRGVLRDDLSALAGRWLGLDEDPPMSWLALCPDRGRRGRAEDQRIILQASGPFRLQA